MQIGGTNRTTAYVNPTQLTFQLLTFATYAAFPWRLIVDGSKNEIYGPGNVNPGSYITYSYDASGVAMKSTTNSSLNYAANNTDDVQLIGGRLYTSYGQVDDPETGALIGTFYSSGTFRASYQWAGPTGARLTRWSSDGLAHRVQEAL